MPIYNWLGGAEVSHSTSDLYKQKVIEFLELDGFILIQTSSRVVMTPDLIFRKPELEGKTDIYVETKYDDVSLSDRDFLSELGRYFILYVSGTTETFDLYIYVRKCKNLSKWKQIFSANSYDENKCVTLFRTLSQNEDLNKEERQKIEERNFGDFRRFISDTYVHQMDYDRLLMRIEEKKKGRKDRSYGYDYYLRELPPIKHKQQIIGNFVEIEDYSGSFCSYGTKGNINYQKIHDLVKSYEPIYLRGNIFYCLEGIPESLKNYINEETRKVLSPKEWIKEDPDRLSILQILYKKYILNFGVERGCNHVFVKADLLYFSHKDYTKDLTHVEGKQIARLFRDTGSPFVKHEAIEIDVKIYDRRLFAFFSPRVLFTDRDKEIITGRNVKRLYQIFSPKRYENNLTIFGDMKWWFDFLCGGEKTLLKTSKLFAFVGDLRPPKNSTTRNGLSLTQRMEDFFDVQT
jgi:hypothetical protein